MTSLLVLCVSHLEKLLPSTVNKTTWVSVRNIIHIQLHVYSGLILPVSIIQALHHDDIIRICRSVLY